MDTPNLRLEPGAAMRQASPNAARQVVCGRGFQNDRTNERLPTAGAMCAPWRAAGYRVSRSARADGARWHLRIRKTRQGWGGDANSPRQFLQRARANLAHRPEPS